MPRKWKKTTTLAKKVAKLEETLKKEKPEAKSTDVLNVDGNGDPITINGPYNGVGNAPYDITGKFIQGVQNMSQLEGNYCKLTSMDFRFIHLNISCVKYMKYENYHQLR